MCTCLFSKSTGFTIIWFYFDKFLVQIVCLLLVGFGTLVKPMILVLIS